MSEKKRKRHDDGGERPSKKAAIALPMGNVKVEVVENKDGLGPVLTSMPGLDYPSEITFKPYRSRHQNKLLLHSAEHTCLQYTAREEKDGSSESLLQDYVGVYDPATRKLQVVQVPKLTVRVDLQKWRANEFAQQLDAREGKQRGINGEAEISAAGKKRALIAEFGSKKSKKAISDFTENAITQGGDVAVQDDIIASAISQTTKDPKLAMPTTEELAAAVDSSKPRPVANIGAEFPADVYPINTIVGKDLMGLIPIKDWVEAVRAGQGVKMHSAFVAHRMFKLAKAKEIQKLKVLRYILLCINFNSALKHSKGAKRIPHKDKLAPLMGEDIPGPVIDAIRRKFASENNDMTRWHVDNLITHIAAAALIVDGFEVDVDDLRNDLKLDNREIKQYFQEIGCKVVAPTEAERNKMKISKAEAVNHWVAKLKIPLYFPKMSRGPRRRG